MKSKVIVIGEVHGTKESPEFVFGLAKAIRKQGHLVEIAFELPKVEELIWRDFSKTKNRKILLKSNTASQKAEDQDGRTSEAMARLLIQLNQKNFPFHFFDTISAKTSQERDEQMAKNIVDVIPKASKSNLIVLTGNIHSRLTKGLKWNPSFRPFAYILSSTGKKEGFSVTSIDIKYSGGTMWICTDMGCGNTPSGPIKDFF